MEQLALDYRKQVDKLFVRESDKEELYNWLHSYNEKELSVHQLVSSMRSIISHPDQLVLFEHSQCLIRHEDQLAYGLAVPKCSAKRVRNVLLSAAPAERIGLSVRGGLEHRIGFFVVEVEPASAAERCGVTVGDEILRVNGHTLKTCTHKEAINLISRHKHMLALRIRHVGMFPVPVGIPGSHNWTFSDDLHLGMNGNMQHTMETESPAVSPFITRAQVHNEIPTRVDLDNTRKVTLNHEGHVALGFNIVDTRGGVFVSTVKQNTPAAAAGVVAGDEILQVNELWLRKATTQEIVAALRQRGKLEIVLRTFRGFQRRSSSSISICFTDPNVEAENRIEAKIDRLFETNLAKSVQNIRGGETEANEYRNYGEMEENCLHVGSSKEPTPPTSPPDLPAPPPPPPPPPLPASLVRTTTTKLQTSESTRSTGDISPTARKINFESEHSDKVDGGTAAPDNFSNNKHVSRPSTVDSEQSSVSSDKMESSDQETLSLKDLNESHPAGSHGSFFEDARIAASRRQKLEAELRERLKIERQKRLVHEKSLRLDRLRQELKETEREEARLQKWLADSENVEDIHHTVGGFNYDSTDSVITKIQPAEFDLTTPPDLWQRNTRTIIPRPSNSANPFNQQYNFDRKKIVVSETSKGSTSEIRFEKEVDGRRIVISEIKETAMSQGKLANKGYQMASDNQEDKVRRPSKATFTVVSSPDYPRVNTINEITFF